MAFCKTLRPGLIQLRVTNLEESVKFHKEIIGLEEVGRTEDGRVMLKAYDEFDHHSVVLKQADESGFDSVAFKVIDNATLEELKDATVAFGYEVEEVPANTDQPGYGKRYATKICTGHRIELYAEVEQAANIPMLHNPDPWGDAFPRGMMAQRFDHLLLYGPNITEAVRYFTEVLGMFVPECCKTAPDTYFAAWLTSGNKAHDIAFVEYEKPNTMHHYAYLLEDWNNIGLAADIIGKNKIPLDIGPTRHAITRGQTIYFWEPSGIRIETYAGGYAAYPDHPQRTWDAEQIGRGLFYYSGDLIPSFLEVVT